MSASLVGSEMCIRDSSHTDRQPQCRCIDIALGLLQTASTRATRLAAHLAVSYTHLTLPTICSV
eukprot:8994798-Alexandrium_andersonii.AAC.1